MQNVFGKRNWTILLLFGLIGQIAWAVENMYFNLFVFETIAPDLDGDCLVQDVVCPPMAEELVYENDRVLILTESASMKYLFGKLTSGNFVRSFPIE